MPSGVRRRLAGRTLCVAVVGGLLGGCGGVTGGSEDPGYPTAHPAVTAATALQPRLDGQLVHLTVPPGWSVARLDTARGAARSFVLLNGECYLSVSITGASDRAMTAAQVDTLYTQPAGGYAWNITHIGREILAVLGQQNTATLSVSRSSIGTAYVPNGAHTYLAIDFGAGIWRLGKHACTAPAVAARLPALNRAIRAIFITARLGSSGTPAVAAPS